MNYPLCGDGSSPDRSDTQDFRRQKKKVRDKLMSLKKDIESGSSFATKAVLYSKDPGSTNGGFYKMNRKTPFVKEFKDVAFSLEEGEISAL
jgi:peptidyl-prolyl cis-trans isomerase SurA